MSIIAVVLLGLVAGLLASRYFMADGEGLLARLIVGVVGATISGYAFDLIGPDRTTSFIDIWGMLMALTGAVGLLVAHHVIRKRQSRSN